MKGRAAKGRGRGLRCCREGSVLKERALGAMAGEGQGPGGSVWAWAGDGGEGGGRGGMSQVDREGWRGAKARLPVG